MNTPLKSKDTSEWCGGRAIGIFDSGIGGLTVLKEVHSLLPQEDIIYLGDTARVPYGTKSRETVLKYTIRNTQFLIEKGVKAIVIACNTASAYGLGSIQEHFQVPIIGVIKPGAKSSVQHTKTHQVGVIGTEGTIQSGAYQEAIAEIDSRVMTVVQPCPLLVALAEEGWCSGPVVDLVLEKYLGRYKNEKSKVDTLILGCTHYPLFKEVISNYLGKGVYIVDSAVETAKTLLETLKKPELEENSERKGAVSYFSTDEPQRMQRLAPLFLGQSISEVKQVEIVW